MKARVEEKVSGLDYSSAWAAEFANVSTVFNTVSKASHSATPESSIDAEYKKFAKLSYSL